MIILPDRHQSRDRFLMPVASGEWRQPSQRRATFGIENQTRFGMDVKCHDGVVRWRGWFDDRGDLDAFLWAIATGSIHTDRSAWRLPTPHWHPDFGIEPIVEYAATTFLTTTGGLQTYSVPADWNASSNTVETIGAGASGAAAGSANFCSGGGGGAYSKQTNIFLTAGGTASYQVGTGGTAITTTGTGTNGNAGGDTWFNGASLAASSVGAKGGNAGVFGNPQVGTTGGASGSGVGATKFSGGGATSGSAIRGGGGAAGPNGAGADSTNANGGNADNGSGGSGGAGSTSGTAGGNGTEFDASHGSGGGGGSAASAGTATAAAGGNYGGGGGGAQGSGGSTANSGAGIQGLIVITYTPLVLRGFNMPMLGM